MPNLALHSQSCRDDMTELHKIITGKYNSNCGMRTVRIDAPPIRTASRVKVSL